MQQGEKPKETYRTGRPKRGRAATIPGGGKTKLTGEKGVLKVS